jgi:hypothetical protein
MNLNLINPDIELNRVKSFEKKQELFNTLHSEHPDHYSRLHLVGFLKFVGYSLDEICAMIDKEASWEDYDANMTFCQVSSVFKPSSGSVPVSSDVSSQFCEGGAGGNAFSKACPPGSSHGNSKLCIVGNSRITCYSNNCDLCKFKVLAGRAKK